MIIDIRAAKKMWVEDPTLINHVILIPSVDWTVLNWTILYLAVKLCLEGHCDVQFILDLLAMGADPNQLSFEGSRLCSPMYLCATAPKKQKVIAMVLATILIQHGWSNSTIITAALCGMIERPDDYDAAVIDFICARGVPVQELNIGLTHMVCHRYEWCREVAMCLLRRGANIYTTTGWCRSPFFIRTFYNTPSSKLVSRVDHVVKYVKHMAPHEFEHAVHHSLLLDEIPLNAWRPYVNCFYTDMDHIVTEKRCGLLVCCRSNLPSELCAHVMRYVTSALASKRIRAWI
jgi:hypothetical protein